MRAEEGLAETEVIRAVKETAKRAGARSLRGQDNELQGAVRALDEDTLHHWDTIDCADDPSRFVHTWGSGCLTRTFQQHPEP